jgi:hypothetical protein
MSDSELHQYFRNVLEKGDHGKSRLLEYDASTLNDVIDRHAAKIGEGIVSCYREALVGV